MKRKYNNNKKRYNVNERIRYPQVRLIADDGENVGVVDTRDALARAREKELDLVVITDKAEPPVAKILDFNKYLYEESKKQSQIKAKSKKSKLKEFRFGPQIASDAVDMRVNRAKEFLLDGNRVKFTVQLRGRQKAHPEFGFEKLQLVVDRLADIAKTEDPIKQQGGNIAVTFVKK